MEFEHPLSLRNHMPEIVGEEKYCETCKPGMEVVSNNLPFGNLVLRNLPCVCKKTPTPTSEVR